MLRACSLLAWVWTVSSTDSPTHFPSFAPSLAPTLTPSLTPTLTPSQAPSLAPSLAPSSAPSLAPSALPTNQPTVTPTAFPTSSPTLHPTSQPTEQPTLQPTLQPTERPTARPTTPVPTRAPTTKPTLAPSAAPTLSPTVKPAVNSLSVYGGPLPTMQAFSQTFSDFSKLLNLWPHFRIIPSCAGKQASCGVYAQLKSMGTEANISDIIVALRDVVGSKIVVRTDQNVSQVVDLAPRVGNSQIFMKGSQTNNSALFVNYGTFDNIFARTDKYDIRGKTYCDEFNTTFASCDFPLVTRCRVIEETTPNSSIVSFIASKQSTCEVSANWVNFRPVAPLPHVVRFIVPRYFTFEYAAGLTYGLFTNSTALVSENALSKTTFQLNDLSTRKLYIWDSNMGLDTFRQSSPSFEIQGVQMDEPISILIISPTANCSVLTNGNETCYMESQFDIHVICDSGNSNNLCGVTVKSSSAGINVAEPFQQELTNAGPKSLRADTLANLQLEKKITLTFTTISQVYTMTLITPYIDYIIAYGSLDNITFAPILLSAENVLKEFDNNFFAYQFSASRFYRFAFNCSTEGRISMPILRSLLRCIPQELTPDVFSTPVFQPVFTAGIISLVEEHSTIQYNFQPYVQTINNIIFRGSQEEKGSYSIIDFTYDPKIKYYSLAVPQWFTMVATITPCPQKPGEKETPCLFNYDLLPSSRNVGEGGRGTTPLRMKTLSEFNVSNLTSYPITYFTVSLPNATTTFELKLSSYCDENFFYPSIAGPVVCNTPALALSACCPCPMNAKCAKNSTRPVALPGYQQSNIWSMVRCDPLSACVGDGVCAEGYTDQACSRCDRTQTRSSDLYYRVNHECQKCPDNSELVMIIGILLFLIVLMLFLKISKPDYTKKYTLSITLAFAQIVSIFASFPVDWPLTTLFLFDLFSFLNFNIDLFSPDCAIKMDFFSKWILKMMLPVICAGVFAIIYVLIKTFTKLRKAYISFMVWDIEEKCAQRVDRKRMGEDQKEAQMLWKEMNVDHKLFQSREDIDRQWEEEHLGERFIHALVTASIVAYTFLAKTASEPLNCVSQSGGVSHVRADPAAYCDENWEKYAILSYIAVLVYTVGIPVVFTCVLIRAWYTKTLDDPKFYYKFGHLVLPYRPLYWYWEIIQMSRKLITVLLIEFFTNASGENTKIQINSVLIVLVFFLALQEFVKPYEFSWCNRVAFTWNTFTLIVLMSALLFSFSELSESLAVGYGLALLAAAGFTVFVSLYAFLQEMRRARSRRILFAGTNQLAKEKEEQELLTAMFGPNLAKSLHRKTRDLPPTQRNFMYRRLGTWQEQGANSGIGLEMVKTR